MTITNEQYIESSWAKALGDFDSQAGPSNINEPLFTLACRLLELANASSVRSQDDAEREASDRARLLGHDETSIRDTIKSALRTIQDKPAHVPPPIYSQNGHTPQGYANLEAYAKSRGVVAEVFERAGWSDSAIYEFTYTDKQGKPATGYTDDAPLSGLVRTRRALRFETDAGPRWRLIDQDKPRPKYWHKYGTHTDDTKSWYKLAEALALGMQAGYLVLCNGEASTVVAQSYGVPATCETGGGEHETPDRLLQFLKLLWPADKPIFIVLDCDAKGIKASIKKAEQYRQAGYTHVRALDLGGNDGFDLADFCNIHRQQAAQDLPGCADVPGSLPGPSPAQPTSQAMPPAYKTPSERIIDLLAQNGWTPIRLNLCTDKEEIAGEDINDTLMCSIRTYLRNVGWKGMGAVSDAITDHAAENAYHPVKVYLDGLVWDKTARIAALARRLIGENPVVVYRDGTVKPLNEVYLLRWLIGCVAKVRDRHQNAMLVLSGPQGSRKSSFVRWLCPLPAYHIEEAIDVNDKDSRIRLISKWIWEIPEIDTVTRRADAGALKHFISQQEVTVRKPYGRHDIVKPALASLVGTVNGSGFLIDDTGNRRFFVLDIAETIDGLDQFDVSQIWAEADFYYKSGEPWRLLPEENEVQVIVNRKHITDSLIADYIRRLFVITNDPTDRLTSTEIIEHLQSKNVRVGLDHGTFVQLGRAMAALGLDRKRNSGGYFYAGIAPKLV